MNTYVCTVGEIFIPLPALNVSSGRLHLRAYRERVLQRGACCRGNAKWPSFAAPRFCALTCPFSFGFLSVWVFVDSSTRLTHTSWP